jgi:hypothetical protein
LLIIINLLGLIKLKTIKTLSKMYDTPQSKKSRLCFVLILIFSLSILQKVVGHNGSDQADEYLVLNEQETDKESRSDLMQAEYKPLYLLDSIYAYNNYFNVTDSSLSYKLCYHYDSNGNEDEYLYSLWNNSTHWDGKEKEEYAYNEKGQKEMFASYTWDTLTSGWKGNSKQNYVYDENGNYSSITTYSMKNATSP